MSAQEQKTGGLGCTFPGVGSGGGGDGARSVPGQGSPHEPSGQKPSLLKGREAGASWRCVRWDARAVLLCYRVLVAAGLSRDHRGGVRCAGGGGRRGVMWA